MNIIGAEDGNMFCAFKKYGRYSAGTTFDEKKQVFLLNVLKNIYKSLGGGTSNNFAKLLPKYFLSGGT